MAEQLKGEKYCVNCGEKIDEKAEICPKCGVRQSALNSKKKNSGIAAVLSFFITGLGQIYNGYNDRLHHLSYCLDMGDV